MNHLLQFPYQTSLTIEITLMGSTNRAEYNISFNENNLILTDAKRQSKPSVIEFTSISSILQVGNKISLTLNKPIGPIKKMSLILNDDTTQNYIDYVVSIVEEQNASNPIQTTSKDMDDKILIKSEIDIKAKLTLIGIPSILLFISAWIFFILAIIKPYSDFDSIYEYYRKDYNGYEAAFAGHDGCLTFFIIACTFVLLGIITLIIYWANGKCELSITEKNVKGKTLFGKEVVLPLYMVSAYSTRKLFSTIAIATSSGITQFALIGNYVEIGNVLSKKINERQESTINGSKSTVTQSSSMDDIIKLKSMLDSGIITQEEFDAKKKQLLGL